MAIDEILDLLGNGEWHELREIRDKTRLQELKVEILASFLAEYDFLEFDEKENRVKLSPQLLLFLKKIGKIERENVG